MVLSHRKVYRIILWIGVATVFATTRLVESTQTSNAPTPRELAVSRPQNAAGCSVPKEGSVYGSLETDGAPVCGGESEAITEEAAACEPETSAKAGEKQSFSEGTAGKAIACPSGTPVTQHVFPDLEKDESDAPLSSDSCSLPASSQSAAIVEPVSDTAIPGAEEARQGGAPADTSRVLSRISQKTKDSLGEMFDTFKCLMWNVSPTDAAAQTCPVVVPGYLKRREASVESANCLVMMLGRELLRELDRQEVDTPAVQAVAQKVFLRNGLVRVLRDIFGILLAGPRSRPEGTAVRLQYIMHGFGRAIGTSIRLLGSHDVFVLSDDMRPHLKFVLDAGSRFTSDIASFFGDVARNLSPPGRDCESSLKWGMQPEANNVQSVSADIGGYTLVVQPLTNLVDATRFGAKCGGRSSTGAEAWQELWNDVIQSATRGTTYPVARVVACEVLHAMANAAPCGEKAPAGCELLLYWRVCILSSCTLNLAAAMLTADMQTGPVTPGSVHCALYAALQQVARELDEEHRRVAHSRWKSAYGLTSGETQSMLRAGADAANSGANQQKAWADELESQIKSEVASDNSVSCLEQ